MKDLIKRAGKMVNKSTIGFINVSIFWDQQFNMLSFCPHLCDELQFHEKKAAKNQS